MQIPGNPFPTGPGFLQRPQPGARQQANADLQAKANAPGAEPAQIRPRTAATPLPAAERPQAPSRAATAGLARPQTLEEAVRTLSDEGRLPPRGSLVDISA